MKSFCVSCPENIKNVETCTSCFGPGLNSCLLDCEAGMLVVRFL